jgi:uncharacterized protein YneF (UPF0154 family)
VGLQGEAITMAIAVNATGSVLATFVSSKLFMDVLFRNPPVTSFLLGSSIFFINL